VVLGGIYALERIARDSPADRRTIGEILCAHVRFRAPWPPTRLKDGQPPADHPADQLRWLQAWAPDVQAALTVLGRGQFHGGRPNELDLSASDLRNAFLPETQLVGVFLRRAPRFWYTIAHRIQRQAEPCGRTTAWQTKHVIERIGFGIENR
jgi:hypothetical protein